MHWNTLNKNELETILGHITQAADPSLFSLTCSEASYRPLSFYQDYMVYRVVNYATLPSFSLDFLSNGETFHLLDGTAIPIDIVNKVGGLYLTQTNVIDYVDFYMANIRGEDGDVYFIKDIDSLPFIDSLSMDQQLDLKKRHSEPVVHKTDDGFIIDANIFYGGTLLSAHISVDKTGAIELRPGKMMMSATSSFGEA